jgi:C-terminal processing protease CtpA/Prc
MKIFRLSIGILLLPIFITCQEVDLYKYPALQKAKETSLFRADVDWDEISKEYIRIAESSESETAKYEYLLLALGDDHGMFRNSTTFQPIAYYKGPSKDKRSFNRKFHNEVINDITARFSYQHLLEDIGYLKVVGIGPQNPMEVDAATIQNAIAELKSNGVDQWILDLRYNGGGNMNPMLSGLSALLGNGNIGGSIDKTGAIFQDFQIRDNKFYDTENLVIDIQNPIQGEINDKVAVLISKYTASSGELTAVAFKGRDNTRFFGQRTDGKTTVTGWERINDETMMLISLAYYQDRKGNVYERGVEPDVEIDFDEFGAFEDDVMIQKSTEWLKKKD